MIVIQVEEIKRRAQARVQEAEQAAEAAVSRANALEKAKQRLQGELEDALCESERVCFNKIKKHLDEV